MEMVNLLGLDPLYTEDYLYNYLRVLLTQQELAEKLATNIQLANKASECLGNFFELGFETPGANFSYIFFRGKSLSAENPAEFPRKMIFQNFFRGKFHFSQHFFGGIFPRNFPRKKCTKNRPQVYLHEQCFCRSVSHNAA
jgi:hypothetical protein